MSNYKSALIYLAGSAAINLASSFLVDKTEKTTDLDNKSALPRVLITVAIGGLIYLAASEYRRAFEPEIIKEMKKNFVGI